MAQHLGSLKGSEVDVVKIQRALISVYDKTGVADLARALASAGVEILSTGGTAKLLTECEINVTEVSEYTSSSEILGGRVKTLHPKVHGGLLYVRGNQAHEKECEENDIRSIDLLVMNLYPFEAAVASGADFATCVENIDIGGPAMLRSSAKNHAYVTVLTSPAQYTAFVAKWYSPEGPAGPAGEPYTTLEDRRAYALHAFQTSAHYDSKIAEYFVAQEVERRKVRPMALLKSEGEPSEHPSAGQDFVLVPPSPTARQIAAEPVTTEASVAGAKGEPMEKEETASLQSTAASVDPTLVTRTYMPKMALKYGINPHQTPAGVYSIVTAAAAAAGGGGDQAARFPFTVLSGTPGYINLLDALYGWQLVREASAVLGAPVAASYKHCSPAGAAVGNVPLTPAEAQAYEVQDSQLSEVARAYLRARNADPMCSFGDFAAVSHTVDVATAKLLKPIVCDGIIAPAYEPEALEILRAKKKSAFIVLQGDGNFVPPTDEYRELFGVALSQRRNDQVFSAEHLNNVVVVGSGLQEGTTGAGTGGELLPEAARRDLILASIAIKYTQSNSVAYARHGQLIGVGAGQQSRVDCVKLAGRKVATWYLRQHPLVQALQFKESVRKQDRINARVRYIEGDFTETEMASWLECFEVAPAPLSAEDKAAFMQTLDGVSIASDAFFPFRDSIDHASKYGVSYVAQPGGSVADDEVKGACAEYGMTMVFTNLRLFLH